jgi:hypothetical protein
MFWEAVQRGIGVLWHWQTYVASLEYFAITFVPMLALSSVFTKKRKAIVAVGCLSMLALPAIQVFALVVFVLTLWPIMLGLSDHATWAMPWQLAIESPGALAGFIGMLLVVAVVLAFIPLLGQLQSLHTLVLGIFAIGLVVRLIDGIRPDIAFNQVHFWPGFWFVVGLLVVGGVVGWLARLLAAVVATALDSAMEGLGSLVVFPLGAVFGLVPLFIYGAWVGMQFQVAR